MYLLNLSLDKNNNQSGSVLVGSVLLMFIIGVFGYAYLSFGGHEASAVEAQVNDLRILWTAEEALSRAAAQITNLPSPHGFSDETAAADGYYARYTIEYMPEKKDLTYRVRALVYENGEPEKKQLELVSLQTATTATEWGIMENFPGASYYATGDTVDGPIHTNTHFNITGHPVFMGSTFEYGSSEPGYNCRASAACTPELPKNVVANARQFDFTHMADRIRTVPVQVTVPAGKTASVILQGGKMLLRYRDRQNPALFTMAQTMDVPSSGGMYFLGDVEVEGTFNGQLSIGSSGNIIITDNIVYTDADPVTGKPKEDSPNVLGLIAEGNVKVNQTQSMMTLGKGIIIDAAVVALNKSFEVVNYRQYQQSMGNMQLWGSVIQWERGIMGNVRMRGTIKQGYVKKWHYDRRLSALSLPFFPPLVDEKGNMTFKTVYWGRSNV